MYATRLFVPDKRQVIAETDDVDAPAASRSKPSNLIRIVNRARLNMRPKDPRDFNL